MGRRRRQPRLLLYIFCFSLFALISIKSGRIKLLLCSLKRKISRIWSRILLIKIQIIVCKMIMHKIQMTNKSKSSQNMKKYRPNKKISRWKMNSILKLDLLINNQTISFLRHLVSIITPRIRKMRILNRILKCLQKMIFFHCTLMPYLKINQP